MKKSFSLITLITSLLLSSLAVKEAWSSEAWLGMERRRPVFATDFAYFIYPIAGSVPGLGNVLGAGATFSNIAETDVDFTGFSVHGDFEANGATVLNMHILPKRLILDLGYYDFIVAPSQYRRGMNSDKKDVIHPKVEGDGALSQLTFAFFDRMFEIFGRYGLTNDQIKEVLDREGNEFANVDRTVQHNWFFTQGITFDITDDRQDPRKGVRFETARKVLSNDDPLRSNFDIYDYNLTGYLPLGKASTWVFNLFRSDAIRQRKGPTDRAFLKAQIGLKCDFIPDPQAKSRCEETESRFLEDAIGFNNYGIATPLGGTQRLRSYSNWRYKGGHTLFTGTEFRWNLTEESTPMNWYLLKGLRTNLQAAFFAEMGTVADKEGDLGKETRSSYGMGLRVLFSGATIRMDYSVGSEGGELIFFLDYPWSMFSVDSPG